MGTGVFKYFSRDQFCGAGGYLEIGGVAYPLVLMGAGNLVMMFTDRLFLARAGTDLLAAALPAGITYFTMYCLYVGVARFTATLVAQFHGAGDRRNCVRAAWNGFYLAAMASAVVATANPALCRAVLKAGGLHGELLAPAWEYLDGLRFSGVFACLAAPLLSFHSGRGRTLPVAAVTTAACALNIVLNYAFIFGKLGAPKWGIYGAGVATTVSGGFSFVCAAVLFAGANGREYALFRLCGVRPGHMKKILLYGLPAGMQELADTGSFMVTTLVIGSMSVEAAAANTIAMSMNNLSFAPLIGLADATAIVAGQYIGRGSAATAESAVCRAWRMSFVYMLLCAAIYLTMPGIIAEWFRPGGGAGDFGEVVKITTAVLACAAVFNLFDSVKFVMMGGLRGAGDTLAVFLLTTGSQWLVMVPGLYLISGALGGDIYDLWYFLTGYFGFEAALVWWRFRSGRWKRLELIGERAGGKTP